MARTLRIVECGCTYHVAARGNDGRPIFLDETDFERFMIHLDRVAWRYGWEILGYCFMTNHIHLLVRVPLGGLSEGMQELLSGYTAFWNHRHGHTGHLFRQRFFSKKIKDESQFLVTACYIDLNPVTARLCRRPENWKWSSYRAHVGSADPPAFLAVEEFLNLVGPTPPEARVSYRGRILEALNAVSDAGFKRPGISRG
jgi:REP element-mobilizing transposase RayT